MNEKLKVEMRSAEKGKIKCNFCGGSLGAIETQEHPNPDYAEYRTCLKCKHQWAKRTWNWLKKRSDNVGQINEVTQECSCTNKCLGTELNEGYIVCLDCDATLRIAEVEE